MLAFLPFFFLTLDWKMLQWTMPVSSHLGFFSTEEHMRLGIHLNTQEPLQLSKILEFLLDAGNPYSKAKTLEFLL